MIERGNGGTLSNRVEMMKDPSLGVEVMKDPSLVVEVMEEPFLIGLRC